MCNNCPRSCNVSRTDTELGYCNTNNSVNVSSVCIHNGEEPVFGGDNGICNVFFSNCNMQCVYCQNYQISGNNDLSFNKEFTIDEIVKEIKKYIPSKTNYLGFVSPSHQFHQTIEIIEKLNSEGITPTTVYNTNCYDSLENLKTYGKYFDVYLPDFKYADNNLSKEYSDTPDYFEVAKEAIKEMYNQKGSDLVLNEDETIKSGLIIRHLVLPGNIENSKKVLKFIAEELSTDISISLMSQYNPTLNVKDFSPLNRTLSQGEYYEVIDELDELGFDFGWMQELDSSENYNPDFEQSHPFETN